MNFSIMSWQQQTRASDYEIINWIIFTV